MQLTNPLQSWRWLAVAAAACGLMILSGSGCSKPVAHVAGSVTVNGEPLPEGTILFVPDVGTEAVSGSSRIKDGQYEIGADKELTAGSYKVEVRALRGTGRILKTEEQLDGDAAEYEEVEQYIPPQYNTSTTLRAELSAGENKKDFQLQIGN